MRKGRYCLLKIKATTISTNNSFQMFLQEAICAWLTLQTLSQMWQQLLLGDHT